jgi:hypothetical protein
VLGSQSKPAIELVSYKDPYFPEHVSANFPTIVYRRDAGGDLHVVAQRTTPSGGEAGSELTELLYVHVFWMPRPGKTHSDSSASNAVLRYVVRSEPGAVVYIGTGFVYPTLRRNGELVARVESAELRLESRAGSPSDFLGDLRLTGELAARDAPGEALALIREMNLEVDWRASP